MTAAIHFTGVISGGSGVIATRGLCKTKCITSTPTSSSPPINPPRPRQNKGEHKRRFQGLHTRTRINLRATPAMVNPRVNPLGSRAQGMKLSLLFPPLLANQSQPQNNTPFARRLQYDGALSISASSSTACFARRLCQFPLEAAPGVISSKKHADKPSPGQEASEQTRKQAGQAGRTARRQATGEQTSRTRRPANRQASKKAGAQTGARQEKQKQTSSHTGRRASRHGVGWRLVILTHGGRRVSAAMMSDSPCCDV